MNLQEQFRGQLLEHEMKQLLQEGKTEKVVDKVIQSIIKFFKKSGDVIIKLLKIKEKREIALRLYQNFKESLADFKAGRLNPKNPNYDKSADKKAWDFLKDLGKLLAFAGFNMLLNILSFGTGFIAGAAVMFFRKMLPQRIMKYFMLGVEKVNDVVDGTNKKIEEFLTLMEDMSYWSVDDATQDEFTIGR
jgi:hypothetical protein